MADLTASKIRQSLDDLAIEGRDQGGYLTTLQEGVLANLSQQWKELRDSIHSAYWPIIDDRIALCESYVVQDESEEWKDDE